MSRIVTVSGGQVGQTLEIKIEFDGTDCVPGDKWRLSAAGLILAPVTAQEIPAGATSHTFTWKSATPLPAGLASPIAVELRKEHGAGAGPTPVKTIAVAIQPAATATPAPAAATVTPPAANPAAPAAATPAAMPQPLQVQIIGPTPGSAAKWINGAGIMGWLGGLVIILVVLAFLWVVLKVIAPTAINGLSGGVHNVPAGQSVVMTEVKQTTVSTDTAVLQEATKASANITH